MYITSYTLCVKCLPGVFPTGLTNKFNLQATLQERLCNLSASFSRVRWQFPSPRKLHKLLYSYLCLSLL
nr:MAG TPA: hypothetical protein [Caudoviricetes sp.]